jgi:hypothetical protein
MAMHWVVNSELKMIYCTDDEGKSRCSIGSDQMWIQCPEGVAPGNCKVAGEWPELSLVDGSADKAGPKWDALREARDAKLAKCDWTQGSDSPLATQAKTDWSDYRQSLRDLPANTENPEQIEWPIAP